MKYDLLFWGYIIKFIDIRIGEIDIRTDFLGILLILLSCKLLSKDNYIFKKVLIVALLFLPFSMIDTFNLISGTNDGWIHSFISGAFDCLLVGLTYKAIFFNADYHPGFIGFYVTSMCVGFIGSFVLSSSIITALSIITSVALHILFLNTIYQTKKKAT